MAISEGLRVEEIRLPAERIDRRQIKAERKWLARSVERIERPNTAREATPALARLPREIASTHPVFLDGFDMSRARNIAPQASDPLRVLARKAATIVPPRIQEGPTCGLYALGMVMDFWNARDSSQLNPLVQASDASRAGATSRAPHSSRELLADARAKKYTTQGEMFRARDLGRLAGSFGYAYQVHGKVSFADMRAALDRGHPLLVAFDVDYVGNPGLFNGARAHWGVLKGWFEKDGVSYVVAMHAWDGQERVWRADDLLRSMHQLKQTDFWGGTTDITGMLNARVVEVYPRK